METRFARRPAAARLRHVNTVSRFLAQTLHTASRLARPTPALKFIAALAAMGLFAGIPANALITPTAPVGATPGSFAVSPSGAATYTIPIVVAPGTNGIQPNLSFVYNSQGGNGLLGIGWALGGLSVIHRCGATIEIDGFKGGVNYDANDRFCMDGERLISVGTNQYRTFQESLQKVVATGAVTNPDYFVVTDKAGTTREYATPIEAAGKPNIRRLWALSRVRDRQGNFLTIVYDKTDVPVYGDYRPTQISYTGNDNAGLTANNVVTFEYTTRTDKAPQYEGGSRITTLKLLNKITTCASAACSPNTIVREYWPAYNYTNVAAFGRARLTGITECGTDGACLPATTFEWTDTTLVNGTFNGTGSLSPYSAWNSPVTGDFNGDGRTDVLINTTNAGWVVFLAAGNGTFNGGGTLSPYSAWHSPRVGDFNGDGRSDVLINTTNAGWAVFLSTPSGSFNGAGYLSPYSAWEDPVIGDFNGDGRSDVLINTTNAGWAVFLAAGNGSFNGGGYLSPYSAWHSPTVGDFNGDGRTDVLINTTNAGWGVFLATSNGSFNGAGYLSPYSAWHSPAVGDFNGDGRSDVLINTTNAGWGVFLATGDGTFNGGGYLSSYSAWHSPSLGDFNGDGRDDIVINTTNAGWLIYVSNGDGQFTGTGTFAPYSAWYGPTGGDFDGDGKSDILINTTGDWTTMVAAPTNTPGAALLVRITNGFGARTNIEYKPLSDGNVYIKDADLVYPYLSAQDPMYVVASVSTTNGVGGLNTTNYQYRGLRSHWYAGTSLGFRWIQAVGPDGLITVTSYNQDRNAGTDGTVALTQVFGPGNVILKSTTNTWVKANAVCGGTSQPQLTSSVETTRELNGNLITQINTSNSYDTCGFPTTTVVDFNDGWRKTVTNTVTNDTATWCLGQIAQSQVTAEGPGATPKTRTSSFIYSNCLVASETIEPGNSALALTTTYGYDAFGNRTSKTISGADIVTRTESQVYDASGRFVVSSTNALGHTTTFGYDTRGLLTSQTDPNGLTTTWDYDGFGRKGKEIRPDGTQTIITYESTPLGYSIYADAQGAADIHTFYDMLGRPYQTNTTGFGGAWIHQYTQYNALGRIASKSNPYLENGTRYDTTYNYDLIGRVTSVTPPGPGNRTVTTSYSGLTTTTSVTSPTTRTTTTVKNSQGKVVSVTDSAGTTSYVYDPFLNLTQVTDAAGNVITMSYDIRGRKTAMHDPDMGNWSYTYDVLSELKTQTDAKGQLISMNYDKLGRMTSRTTPEGTSTWTYDTTPHGIGKLASLSGPGGYQESYVYDLISRPASTTTTIGGNNYTVTTGYDNFGRLDTIIYPVTGYTVKQKYDDFGYLYLVYRVKTDSTLSLLWQTNTADAFNHVTSETFGGVVTSLRNYDPATVDLVSIQTGSGTNPQNIQNLSYAWDVLHNLTGRTDTITSLNETFTYDNVNRLTNATGAVAKTYAYNAIGNITSKSDVGTYSYNASGPSSVRPHAVTATAGVLNATYAYDANGNMLSGGGRTLTYTSFNKPQSIAGANGTTTLSYDANYNRIQKQTSTRTTAYVGKLFERVTAGTLVEHKHYIYGGKSLVATYTERNNGTQPETRYVHTDHLDSVSVITDDNGAVVERLSFDPFGKRRQTNGQDASSPITSGINRGFTRHEQDDEVALINMNARLYDPMLGRFITSDTVVDGIAGQGLNRYSYVRNNPLSATDPTGNFSLKRHIKAMTRFYIQPSMKNGYQAIHTLPGVPIAERAMLRHPSLRWVGQAVATSILGPVGAGGFSAYMTMAAGGSSGEAFRMGMGSFISSYADQWIDTKGLSRDNWRAAATYAAMKGVAADLSGGSFVRGFAGGFAGQYGRLALFDSNLNLGSIDFSPMSGVYVSVDLKGYFAEAWLGAATAKAERGNVMLGAVGGFAGGVITDARNLGLSLGDFLGGTSQSSSNFQLPEGIAVVVNVDHTQFTTLAVAAGGPSGEYGYLVLALSDHFKGKGFFGTNIIGGDYDINFSNLRRDGILSK